VLPLAGSSLDATRAAAFHFMAIGQLFMTYPARHTALKPLRNPHLHAAVAASIAIQIAATWVPVTATLLGGAAIPLELWVVVFGSALVMWRLAETFSWLAWRRRRQGENR
jgi:Ca2+-transporting ATPase